MSSRAGSNLAGVHRAPFAGPFRRRMIDVGEVFDKCDRLRQPARQRSDVIAATGRPSVRLVLADATPVTVGA
jgi:hypothetical protein